MTSTALVGIVPHHAHAADKIIDGVQETINTPETFEDVIVGKTLPSSELEVVAGGDVTASNDITVGEKTGSEGTVTIYGSGSKLTATDEFELGKAGTGTLDVTDGGAVDIGGNFNIGRDRSGSGTVTISGTGSKLTATGRTYVGRIGNGTLNITNGAKAIFTKGPYLSRDRNATGTVTISGSGSNLTAAGLMSVGAVGTGVLTISDGGTAEVGSMTIGSGSTSGSSVTVSGSDSALTVTRTGNAFDVGFSDTGTLSISDGGKVVVGGSTSVGRLSKGSGTVTISGSDSKLTSADDIFLGTRGSGTLNITNGGEAASSKNVYFGNYEGSSGTATISGSGSKLTSALAFDVGKAGTGTLNVTDGGAVDIGGTFTVGRDSSGSGTVTISGNGSKLTATDKTYIARNGNGTLNITDGAEAVFTRGPYLSRAGDATGTITISGPGSKLTADGFTVVGIIGTGVLSINDGGTAEVGSMSIAAFSGTAQGSVTVSGAGSALTATRTGSSFDVGSAGIGTLSISDGGKVAVASSTLLGATTTGSGTVTISDDGSKLTSADNISVGERGAGTLNVTDGGEAASSKNVYFGNNVGASGTATISGSGSKLMAASALDVGKLGTGTLNVSNGGYVDTGNIFRIGNASTGSGTVMISGAGSKIKNIFATYVGKDGQGTLTISNGGRFDGSDVVFLGYGVSSVGTVTVTGAGSKIDGGLRIGDNGAGTLTLSNGGVAEGDGNINIARFAGSTGTLNIGAASGGAAGGAGTIQGANGAKASLIFGAGTGKLVFNHTETDYDFDATASGSGTVLQEAGVTSLIGDFSGFTGAGKISGGTLSVETVFGGSVNVNSGGTLAGTGTTGNIAFNAGSFYQATIGGNGFLTSTGTATIDTGSQVNVEFDDISSVAIWQPIEILTAATITGEFGSTNQDNYLFLNFDLSYDPTSVFLTLSRNGASFSDFAQTPNQVAVANVVNVLPNGNDLYDAFTTQKDAAAIPGILDQLTGEAHASTQSIVIQDAGTFRDIIGNRINAAFATAGTGATSQVSTNGPGDGQPESLPGGAIWGQAYGTFGRLEGNTNAADVKRSAGGLVAGVERNDFFGFNAGILAGFGRSDARVNDRSSDADIDSYTIGAYAGRTFGAVLTKVGTTFTWNDISSQRNVAFPGFTDTLTANYNSRTFQAFGEVGYAFGTPYGMFEPFAGLAVVHLETDSFTETGGAAALGVNGSSQTLGVSTLGMRGSYQVGVLNDGSILTFNGALAWRHSFGDVTPSVTSAFAAGSQPFTVAGTPIDEDTALVEAGFNLAVLERADLSISYRGEFGQSAQDNSFNARLGIKF
ncbi:autotransporter domain-containing protein [Roseibium sp.]|uniref:autotransporter domain-containing protein n=1 Tax=Roseibium sp. TaxID=1936156 RepID=UPI003A96F4B5